MNIRFKRIIYIAIPIASVAVIIGLLLIVSDLRRENRSLCDELIRTQYGMMSIENRRLLLVDLNAGRPDRLKLWSDILRQSIEVEEKAIVNLEAKKRTGERYESSKK